MRQIVAVGKIHRAYCDGSRIREQKSDNLEVEETVDRPITLTIAGGIIDTASGIAIVPVKAGKTKR